MIRSRLANLTTLAIIALVLTGGCRQPKSVSQNASEISNRVVAQKPVVESGQPEAKAVQPPASNIESEPPTAAIKGDANVPPKLPKRIQVVAQKPKTWQRGDKTYTEASLHKNSTLMPLAFPDDVRVDFLILPTRYLMNDEQIEVARKMVHEYDEQYKDILAKRNEILETATDDQKLQIEDQLIELRMDVYDLNSMIKIRILSEILDEEQIAAYRKNKSLEDLAPPVE